MSGIKYLFDTCFILEFHKQNDDVLALINEKNIKLSQCAISMINRLEALGYADITSADEETLSYFLSKLKKISVDLSIENKVIDLRKRYKIKLPDAIVLATALVHHLELLTLDTGLMAKYHKEINSSDYLD